VTVVMPTFNASCSIREALESLFAQSRPPDEIVVVDDGSTDDTFDQISPYLPRLRYHRQAHRGVAGARNTGIALANGDLIAFLDADDWYLPHHLMGLDQRLARDTTLGLVSSGWRRVNEQGQRIVDVEPWYQTPRLDLETWLLWKPVFPGGMMVRRAWFEKIGQLDESLEVSSDVDMALRLALAGCRAVWVRQVSVCYRQHAGNVSRDTAKVAHALHSIHRSVFQRADLSPSIRKLESQVRGGAAVWLAWHALQDGKTRLAREQLCIARDISPASPAAMAAAWQSDFARFSRVAGVVPPSLAVELPLFHSALAVNDAQWMEIEGQLTAAALVWQRVGERGGTDLPRSAYARFENAARDLVKLAQPGLAPSAQSVPPRAVRRWWLEVTGAGLVPASGRGEVTTLYLSAFTQALFHKRWIDGLEAFARACVSAWLPGGLRAWVRFVRAGTRYLLASK
jgi:GT2 family glycosyltransferase